MVGSCKTAVGSGLASLLLAFWQQLEWFSKVGEFSCLGQIKHLCYVGEFTPLICIG